MTEIEHTLEVLLKASPPVLLTLFLNAVGFVLTKVNSIDNKWITLILPVLGMIVYPGLVTALTMQNIVIGWIIGAGAVGGNQLVRQLFPPKDEPQGIPVTPPKP